MSHRFTDRSILITGSTSGIGRAIALLVASQGARVIVTGRNLARGDDTVAAIHAAGGDAQFVAADLDDPAGRAELVRRATEIGGGHLDGLVNCSGIYPFAASTDVGVDDFDAVFNANVKSMFFLTTALLPAMAARRSGAVVNISTALAGKGRQGTALYASSKSAVEALTRVWSGEFGPHGIRVNAVSSGVTNTEGTAPYGADGLRDFHAGTPADRVGEPTEVAAAVAFLLSAEASHIHGAILPVDGGASTL